MNCYGVFYHTVALSSKLGTLLQIIFKKGCIKLKHVNRGSIIYFIFLDDMKANVD